MKFALLGIVRIMEIALKLVLKIVKNVKKIQKNVQNVEIC